MIEITGQVRVRPAGTNNDKIATGQIEVLVKELVVLNNADPLPFQIDDPEAASSMAGVLTQSNSFKLTGKIGRRPSDAELYMAHFMGVGGAGKLISSAQDNPFRTRWYSSQDQKDAFFRRFGKPGSIPLNMSGVINDVKVFKRVLIRHRRVTKGKKK